MKTLTKRKPYINIRQNKLQKKDIQEKRGLLYNDKRINLPRRNNNIKCVCLHKYSFKIC